MCASTPDVEIAGVFSYQLTSDRRDCANVGPLPPPHNRYSDLRVHTRWWWGRYQKSQFPRSQGRGFSLSALRYWLMPVFSAYLLCSICSSSHESVHWYATGVSF